MKRMFRSSIASIGLGRVAILAAAISLCSPWDSGECAAQGDAVPQKTIRLNRRGVNIPVLSQEEFNRRYGNNPQVPKRPDDVLALARLLHPRSGELRPNSAMIAAAPSPEGADMPPGLRNTNIAECGEQSVGVVFSALCNPTLRDSERNQLAEVLDAAVPGFSKEATHGHFRFFYNTTHADPEQNVADADIAATAAILNNAWDRYQADFREPKSYTASDGAKRIDVRVYKLEQVTLGQTHSLWDHIELDARRVVASSCKRQTTPVHELFHRVQYAYDFESGTRKMTWATEATAAWSQKYLGAGVGDYLDRMNTGLRSPNLGLINRSYDAAHFWVYLGQRVGDERQAVAAAWSNYASNGKDMVKAVDSVLREKLAPEMTLAAFACEWNFANFRKNVEPRDPRFDYAENLTVTGCSGGPNFGPLAFVPRLTHLLEPGAEPTRITSTLSGLGAEYRLFTIAGAVRKVDLTVRGIEPGNHFGFALIEIKDARVISPSPASPLPSGQKEFIYTRSFDPGALTQLVLIIVGSPDGGDFTITAQAREAP